jgi:hypothetical protein
MPAGFEHTEAQETFNVNITSGSCRSTMLWEGQNFSLCLPSGEQKITSAPFR